MRKITTRILFKYRGEFYKYLNISTSKDNSFHFHLYEESNEGFSYFPLIKLDDGRTKIEIENPIKTQFLRNKFTFHTSGIIHSSSKNGKRFKDSIEGIPFSEIETSNLILLVAPKKIDSLEKFTSNKKGLNLAIELSEHQNPFSLNFEIYRKSNLNRLQKIPTDISHGPHQIEWPELEFGLRFYTQLVSGKANWPPHSVVLKRKKA